MAVIPPRCKRCQTCHWIRDGCPSKALDAVAELLLDAVARNDLTPHPEFPEAQPSERNVEPKPERVLATMVEQQMAGPSKGGFDKQTYMRDYMRGYRRGKRKTRPNLD
jgi:formate hydrogenlyase subunit 6/NADH:ubiquinone oxidoreductase subunit I